MDVQRETSVQFFGVRIAERKLSYCLKYITAMWESFWCCFTEVNKKYYIYLFYIYRKQQYLYVIAL